MVDPFPTFSEEEEEELAWRGETSFRAAGRPWPHMDPPRTQTGSWRDYQFDHSDYEYTGIVGSFQDAGAKIWNHYREVYLEMPIEGDNGIDMHHEPEPMQYPGWISSPQVDRLRGVSGHPEPSAEDFERLASGYEAFPEFTLEDLEHLPDDIIQYAQDNMGITNPIDAFHLEEEYERISWSEAPWMTGVRLLSAIERPFMHMFASPFELTMRVGDRFTDYHRSAAGFLSDILPGDLELGPDEYDDWEDQYGPLYQIWDFLNHPEENMPLTQMDEDFRRRGALMAHGHSEALGLMHDIGNMGVDYISLMLQMKFMYGISNAAGMAATGYAPAKLGAGNYLGTMLKRLTSVFGRGVLMTQGKEEDGMQRIRRGLWGVAYNMTPYVAKKLGYIHGIEGLGVPAIDAGLNFLISSPGYVEALARSGGFNREFRSTVVPQVLMDVLMAAQTSAMPLDKKLDTFSEEHYRSILETEYGVPKEQSALALLKVGTLMEKQELRSEYDYLQWNLEQKVATEVEIREYHKQAKGLLNMARSNLETMRDDFEKADEIFAERDLGFENAADYKADLERQIKEMDSLVSDLEKAENEWYKREHMIDAIDPAVYDQFTAESGEVNPVSIKQIVETAQERLNVKISDAEIRYENAEAQYHGGTGVVDVSSWSDMKVLSHELWHHIHRQVLDLDKDDMSKWISDYEVDLRRIVAAEEYYNLGYSRGQYVSEAIADFGSYYFTNPTKAASIAPDLYKAVEARLEELGPETQDIVHDLQHKMVRFESQSSIDRLNARLVDEPIKPVPEKILNARQWLVHKFVDDYAVPQAVLDEVGYEHGKFSASEDPIDLYRLAPSLGEKGLVLLTEVDYDVKWEAQGRSLEHYVDMVREDVSPEPDRFKDFDAYMLGYAQLEREAVHLWKQQQEIMDQHERTDIQYVRAFEIAEELSEALDYVPKGDTLRDWVRAQKLTEVIMDNTKGDTLPGTGARRDDLWEVADQLIKWDQDRPHYQEAFHGIVEFSNHRVQYLADKGMYSQEQADDIISSYRWYIPMHRDFPGTEDVFTDAAGPTQLGDLPDPIQRVAGSEKPILNPLETIVSNTLWSTRLADKNEMLASLVDAIGTDAVAYAESDTYEFTTLADHAEGAKERYWNRDTGELPGKFVRYLPSVEAMPPGERQEFLSGKEHIVSIWRNGHRQYYEFHPDLYKWSQGLDLGKPPDSEFGGLAKKAAQVPNKIFKAGAVLDPRFWMRNIVRDEWREAVYREYGYRPFKTYADGMLNTLGMDRKEFDAFFRAAGGSRAGFTSMLGFKDSPGNVAELMKHDNISFNPLKHMGSAARWTEDTRRKGYFVQYLEDYDLNALSDKERRDVIAEAALHSRGGILEDYGIKGEFTRQTDKYLSPFVAAGVTGVRHGLQKAGSEEFMNFLEERDMESAVDFGAKMAMFSLKAFSYIGAPTIANYMRNRENEEYWNLPQYQRDYFWNIDVGDGGWVHIPKPFSVGMAYSVPIERTMAYLDTNDPEHFQYMVRNIIKFGLPFPSLTAYLPWMELMSNSRFQGVTSSFPFFEFGGDIIPLHEQNLAPSLQYGQYTSDTAKALGRRFNISPRVIDYMIPATLASVGRSAMATGDLIMSLGTGADASTQHMLGSRAFAEWLGAMSGAYSVGVTWPTSVNRLYNEYNERRPVVETFETQTMGPGAVGWTEEGMIFSRDEYMEARSESELLRGTIDIVREIEADVIQPLRDELNYHIPQEFNELMAALDEEEETSARVGRLNRREIEAEKDRLAQRYADAQEEIDRAVMDQIQFAHQGLEMAGIMSFPEDDEWRGLMDYLFDASHMVVGEAQNIAKQELEKWYYQEPFWRR